MYSGPILLTDFIRIPNVCHSFLSILVKTGEKHKLTSTHKDKEVEDGEKMKKY